MESMSPEQEAEVERLYQSSLARGNLRNRVWELVKYRGDLKKLVERVRELEVNTRSEKVEGEREWRADSESSAGALFETLREIDGPPKQ